MRCDKHRLPKPGEATSTSEGHGLKACFLEQGCEGATAPKLDVAAIPDGGEVGVDLAGEGQGTILEVAAIRSATDQQAFEF